MENRKELEKEILEFMYAQVSIVDAINGAEAKFCIELQPPITPKAPILEYEYDIDKVEEYLRKLKKYQKEKKDQEDLWVIHNETWIFSRDTIIDYIKDKAYFYLIPDKYKKKVLHQAHKNTTTLYSLFSNLDNLTDIFDIDLNQNYGK